MAELLIYYNTLVRDLQEKRKWRKVLNSPILLVVLLIIVAFLINSNYNIYKKNQIVKMNREESDLRLSQLREKNNRLTTDLDNLKTDRGIEEELRNKFQVTKSGEEVLVVVDDDKPADVPPPAIPKGYWDKFIDFLKQ